MSKALGELDDVHGIEETDDAFHVDHAVRGKFRIAKTALTADIADSIRSVAKGKAAAAEALKNQTGPDGVTRAAEGDLVDDPAFVEDPATAELLDVNRASTAAPFTPAAPALPYSAADLGRLGVSPADVSGALASPNGETTASAADFGRLGVNPQEFGLHAPAPVVGAQPTTQTLPDPNAGVQFGAPAEQPAPVAQPATTQEGGGAGDGGMRAPAVPQIAPFDSTQLDEAERIQQEAIANHGIITADLAQKQRVIQEESNAWMHQQAQDYNAKITANQERLQQVADEIANSPIRKKDPGIGEAIAIGFGAFGSALAGVPNFAMQIIDKRIDDDLAIQKANRAEKNNQIAFYQQQGHSLENAYRLAKADKLAEVAGHVQAAALQAGSQDAIVAAQQAGAELKTRAFRLAQDAWVSDYKMKTAPVAFATEMKTQQLQQEMLHEHARLLHAQAGATAAKHGADAQAGAVLDRLAVGAPVDNREIARLDPKIAERVITLPNGHKFLVQGGVKAADDARAVVSGGQEIAQIVAEAKALREKYGTEWIDRGAVAGSHGLRERYTLALKNLEHLRAITDNEREIAHALFPDTSSPQTDARVNAMLDQALRGAQVKVDTHLRGLGYRGLSTTPIQFSTE